MSIINTNNYIIGDPRGRDPNPAVFERFFLNSGVIIFSVFICVGIQIGLETIFGAFTSKFFSTTISTLIASLIQGAIIGGLSLAVLNRNRDKEVRPPQPLDWITAILGGAIAGGTLAVITGVALGGGTGGGSPADSFFHLVILLVIVLLAAIILLPVIFLLVNAGLKAAGLGVAVELTREAGKSIGEVYVAQLFGVEWVDELKTVKGGCDAVIRGIVVGLTSGMAIFYVEMLRDPGHGFFWRAFVELFGIVFASVVWGLVMAVASAIRGIFDYYFDADFFTVVRFFMKVIFVLGLLAFFAH
jgi:hypothetical protein